MKVLLDENLPHDLRHLLPGHEVFTVAFMGWASTKNGELLKLASGAGFEAMITKDSGVEYQQYLPDLPIAIIVIKSNTNKLDDICQHLPKLITTLASVEPRTLIHVG